MKYLVKKSVIMVLFAIAMTSFIACSDKDDDEPTTVSVTGVSLDQATLTKKVGETFVLKAMVQPEDATNKEVTWKSSDKTVAKVDTNGEVVALKEGQADITVTTKDGNKTAVCTVKVTPKVPLESIEVGEKYYAGIEEEKIIRIVKTPENTTEELQWEIADESIATVDSTGKVTTKMLGETTLTIKTADGRITKTCKILVQPKITFVTTKGEIVLIINAKDEDKEDVWIDLNGNFERDANEGVTKFSSTLEDFTTYTKTVDKVSVYGRITYLNCGKNQLKSLDTSNNTDLIKLYCAVNQLTNLDVSKNTKLNYLSCFKNQLSSLDLSKNTKLNYLSCAQNKLTNLDLSKNTNLSTIYCYINQLTNLDVSKNTKLNYLSCSYNKLTNLNVSKNKKLNNLYCQGNQLTSLDVSMCSNLVGTFDCTQNPNLTCIKVNAEQKANIPSDWKKDDTASYNTTCD